MVMFEIKVFLKLITVLIIHCNYWNFKNGDFEINNNINNLLWLMKQKNRDF